MKEAEASTTNWTQQWVMQHVQDGDHRLTLGPGEASASRTDVENIYLCLVCNSWLRIDVARSAEEFNKIVQGECR